MRLTIAYSRIKKRNLLLINNDTHQRETVSERPIRPPLNVPAMKIYGEEAVGLKNSNYVLNITIFVNMWNVGQFLENFVICQ